MFEGNTTTNLKCRALDLECRALLIECRALSFLIEDDVKRTRARTSSSKFQKTCLNIYVCMGVCVCESVCVCVCAWVREIVTNSVI